MTGLTYGYVSLYVSVYRYHYQGQVMVPASATEESTLDGCASTFLYRTVQYSVKNNMHRDMYIPVPGTGIGIVHNTVWRSRCPANGRARELQQP